ncbi:MAG: aminotransferase class I/II-fold pyridoxal phosphate-dependent enzyme [Candidatus Margulisbacteria bacterium]|nr:aminotransferase class I/II-fold pyridoxal phosphate-dependent enzyme [Candidatus Margulisiibacteriota bacterium]
MKKTAEKSRQPKNQTTQQIPRFTIASKEMNVKVIDTSFTSFPFLPLTNVKIESIPTDIYTTPKELTSKVKFKNLKNELTRILSYYVLTTNEVVSYFSEKDFIKETEHEILNLIESLKLSQTIVCTITKGKEFISLGLSDKNRLKKDRDQSLLWYKENTELHEFYSESRKLFNNVIKKLNIDNRNCYNLTIDPTESPLFINVQGSKCLHFSSSDYLGLSKDPRVIQASVETLLKCGNGTLGSRIMTGSTSFHDQLEETISNFKGTQNTVVFNSGFMTNLSLLGMIKKDCLVFFDSLSHASIIDGISLSKATAVRFKHNDAVDLEEKLEKYKEHPFKLIIMEGIYSLDGDVGRVDKIIPLAKKYDCILAVDEAHSFGALGKTGRGVEEYFALEKDAIDLKMGTLCKSLGSSGGFISGKKLIINSLKYSARPYFFSASLPPNIMSGAIEAIKILKSTPELVQKLQSNATLLRFGLQEMGFNVGNSESQIIPLIIGDDNKVYEFRHRLQENKIFANAVAYPAVSPKKSRIRLCVTSIHTDFHIEKLLNISKKIGKDLKII